MNYSLQDFILLHLYLINDIGSSTIDILVKKKPWDLDLQDFYQMEARDFVRIFGLSLSKAHTLVKGLSDKSLLEKECELLHKYSISWLTVYNDQYPRLLAEIYLAPTILFWQGASILNDIKALAVIGSRSINYYGISAIENFVPKFVQEGYTIVSGGAVGADSIAHQITLDSHGTTIVVLGSGLLEPYPANNKRLFASIVSQGGTLLSIFPARTKPMSGNFPARNRIIAGLCSGCFVVQAALRSGTHITARYALEQGRELFALPGPFDDPMCAGCDKLIQDGAKLVTSAEDVLSELQGSFRYRRVQEDSVGQTVKQDEASPIQQTLSFKAEGLAATILCACSQPSSTDELSIKTGIALAQLYEQLFELELAGLITQHINGLWQRR